MKRYIRGMIILQLPRDFPHSQAMQESCSCTARKCWQCRNKNSEQKVNFINIKYLYVVQFTRQKNKKINKTLVNKKWKSWACSCTASSAGTKLAYSSRFWFFRKIALFFCFLDVQNQVLNSHSKLSRQFSNYLPSFCIAKQQKISSFSKKTIVL